MTLRDLDFLHQSTSSLLSVSDNLMVAERNSCVDLPTSTEDPPSPGYSLHLPEMMIFAPGFHHLPEETSAATILLTLPISKSADILSPSARYEPEGAIENLRVSPEHLLVRLYKDRLHRTAIEMAVPAVLNDSAEFHLHKSADIPMTKGMIDYIEIFRAFFTVISAYRWNRTALEAIRIDDLIYRQVILLLGSYNFQDNPIAERGRAFKFQLIDEICSKLSPRLHRPLTLADIESLSGMSARGLQYAFRERFGCSPMAWVREQRLLLARRRLLEGQSTVMEIAVSCGFGSSSLFGRYYQSRFGESPSDTVRKTR